MALASFIKFDLRTLQPDTVASLVRLAQAKSSAQLIAEKVETQAQYQQVADLGVGLFQGYWFAKPMPATAFEDWLIQALDHGTLARVTEVA